jgi:hypothetical protein
MRSSRTQTVALALVIAGAWADRAAAQQPAQGFAL